MANESVWRRPRTDDDEDELLRQQEEFLRSRQPLPGVGEVINPDIRDKIEKISKTLEDVVHDVPTVTSDVIIGNIVEKKFQGDERKFDNNCLSAASVLGFPKVFKYETNVPSTDKVIGKHSLFWHKIKSQKTGKDNVVKIQKDESSVCCNKEETDVAIDSQLVIEIHKENLEKLSQMSQEEILTEKKKLEETLDPKIIQFLRNKRSHKSKKRSAEENKLQPNVSVINNEVIDTEPPDDKKIKLLLNKNENDVEMNCENASNVSILEETVMDTEVSSDKTEKMLNDDKKMDCKDDTLNIPESSKEILEESKQKGWLHMDRPEPDKLKWMEDLLEEKKNEPMLNEEYNARFDFKGLLLPYKDENLTMDKGLHHHGEEPDRPGYSLQELLQLSRSSTQQQRCTALTTLANVMEKTHKGWYDKALYPAPLTALSQKNILLLLRFSLDDTSVAVITAALQALRAFLVSEADEVCLDRLYGFGMCEEPTLMPELEDKETDSLKDHELAQFDAVATLIRTDILKRIRYILSEIRPPAVGVKCALEILIRLARHSHATAVNIASTADLLNIIVKNFMPLSVDRLAMQDTVNSAYGVPVVTAIKLCRVLVTYVKKPIAQQLKIMEVIPIILTYITSDTGKQYNTNLGIESLRLWQMLLHYEISSDSVLGAVLILNSQLQLLLSNHDIQNMSELSCEYAAALITVTSYGRELMPHVSTLLEKWSVQFSLMSQPTWCVMKLIAKTLLVVYTKSNFRTTRLSIQHVFATLRSSSNLLSDYKLADRIPSCLPNLDVIAEDGKLQPLVSVNSCIPFLATLLNIYNSHSCVAEIRAIIEHPSFYKYMRDLETVEWNLERSWYTRMELYLLTAVVKGAHLLRDTIDNRTSKIIWKINIKLISTLPMDAGDQVKELLEIALSNEEVNLEIITNEFNKLNLTSVINQNKIGLCSNAASLYQRYVVSKGEWNQAAMPKDWLFLPLVHVYTKCKNNVKLQPEDKDSIRAVLSLALILPDLMKKLSPTLRFSRLLLVYLCDTVYLDKDVSVLVSNVMSSLLRKYHARLNFQMELPGLNSFVDLFTALCEHFCSNSYGDDGFASVLLVPLAQRHNAHYRKLLWSEHAAALRYLRLPWDKLLVPAKEYLHPEEEDTSLIESYITALVRETVKETWCPIPFAIAVHHSAMYLKRSDKLATRMRTQMEKLRNRDIADKLLHYTPLQF
ncbi:RNA polymerase II-associated protein 1 isoform X2 [Pseudomyrmex gracilis]|uniref:RNA polymerase II-associated protein 1 isoform X2 n=1 Tax=Pseudomyrmex gracilis TaxID=219809 RepID=UPI000994BF55|nr:RNA polymerase II-associated protein 1 isoform X2 [Pseudomyrmex gracilis]